MVSMRLHPLNWHSLKTRVTLLTLLIFVLSIWSLAWYASRMLREDMQRVLGDQQFSTVSVIAQEIDSNLRDRVQAMEKVAQQVTPAMLADPPALQAWLEQRLLLQLLFNGGAFITGTDGTAIADLPRSAGRTGTNYMDRDVVATPLKEGKTVIGRPAMGKKLGAPIFSITVPIRDSQARVIGVLVGTVNLGQPNFLDQIAKGNYGRTGGYLLIAPQHQLIVTASDKSRTMQPAPAPGQNTMHDRYMAGFEGYGVAVSSRGVTELSAAKAIPTAGWFIVATLPAEEAFAPITDVLRRLLWATAALTLLAGGATWWMLRCQLAPLLATARAMINLSKTKQIPAPLAVLSQDEVGQLSSGFNRLIDTWTHREKALQDSEHRYRSLLENLSSGVVVHGPDTAIVLTNAMAATLLGLSQDQLLGKVAPDPDWCFLQENGQPMPLADYPVNRVFDSGESLRNYVGGVRCPGRPDITWVLCNAYPMLDQAGRIQQVVVTFTDITERKQVEAALIESEERWKFAIEGAGDGLWDWNLQTGAAFFSPRYKTMLGYADHEIGNTADEWRKRIHPDDAPGVLATMQPYLDGQSGPITVEFRMLCRDGSWKWILGRGLVVRRDADGKPLRMIGTNTDITERKEHEHRLEHMAHFDALTNLPNRMLLADRLQHGLTQATRRDQMLAVVYIDLDGFKTVNDQHGHKVGDQLLMAVAQHMKQALREGDTLARLGGDEFVAVLIDLENAAACLPLLNRLLTAAAHTLAVGTLRLQVSASLGVSFFPQAEEVDADQLLRQADQAMYQAKVAGKNRYQLFDAAQRPGAGRRGPDPLAAP